MTARLAAIDLTVRSARRVLLDRVGFEAAASKVTVVLGPNGAGKTTLLEAVLGVRERSGVVKVDGRELRGFSEACRAFAFLPDALELPPEADVRTVVDHAASLRARDPALVVELRRLLRTDPLLASPIGTLSRGEKQRVALLATLVLDRPVVLLDEPFGAFDPLALRDVLAAVRLVAEEGAAIVATVHQLADAQRVGDVFLLLAEGRSVAFGDLRSLRARAGAPDGSLEDVFVALLSGEDHAA
jgi:ABC-2 type transport system ATP-binding protein